MRPVVRLLRRGMIVAVAGASVLAGVWLCARLGLERVAVGSTRRAALIAALVLLPPVVLGAIMIDRRAQKRASPGARTHGPGGRVLPAAPGRPASRRARAR